MENGTTPRKNKSGRLFTHKPIKVKPDRYGDFPILYHSNRPYRRVFLFPPQKKAEGRLGK